MTPDSCDEWEAIVADLEAENKRLRADVARLRESDPVREEYDAVREELINHVQNENDRYEFEIKRLREALNVIAERPEAVIREIARAALASKEPTDE